MGRALAAFLFAAVIVGLLVYWSREQQAIYAMPLVQASEPASVVPWRLYTLCPPNRTNVPVLPRERTA